MIEQGQPAAAAQASTTHTPAAGRRIWPLYAAGFTTAFGAHAIAASLGSFTSSHMQSLLTLGVLLALYDGAEVLLKPVFGGLADRIGPRPVLLAGLAGFAMSSAAFVLANDPGWLWLARIGQGAAASAFSPAASVMVARLSPKERRGRSFGSYGFFKSIGYTAGPLLGGLLAAIGGLTLLFTATAILAAGVAIWAALRVPAVAPLPRARQAVADLARRMTGGSFVRPTTALAAATAALSVGVGFLPVTGAGAGLSPVATGAAVSVLALCAAIVQPFAGRAVDSGRITIRVGICTGLVTTAAGLGAATLGGIPGILLAALLIGAGTAMITPLAFAALAAASPASRLGQTMGAAEVGRELGDAGGPLLVGTIAALTTLSTGYAALAISIAAATAAIALTRTSPRQ